tara:strand:- start:206 stop:496 length:291 start_codon:yes stop_codon:yes gene_type:complete
MPLPAIVAVATKLGVEVGRYLVKKNGKKVLKEGAEKLLKKQIEKKQVAKFRDKVANKTNAQVAATYKRIGKTTQEMKNQNKQLKKVDSGLSIKKGK